MQGMPIDEAFYNKMLLGDPNCKYRIGSKVKKIIKGEYEIYPVGSLATVKGSLAAMGEEVYIINYDLDENKRDVFVMGDKLEAVWDQGIF